MKIQPDVPKIVALLDSAIEELEQLQIEVVPYFDASKKKVRFKLDSYDPYSFFPFQHLYLAICKHLNTAKNTKFAIEVAVSIEMSEKDTEEIMRCTDVDDLKQWFIREKNDFDKSESKPESEPEPEQSHRVRSTQYPESKHSAWLLGTDWKDWKD